MELAVPPIRRTGATPHCWAGSALPDDTLRRSPVLSVFYAPPCSDGRRRSGRRRAPARRRRRRPRRAGWDGPRRGQTATSCARCPRRSPSTGPPSPRPAVTWPARRARPTGPRPRRTGRPPRPRRRGRVPRTSRVGHRRRAPGAGDVRRAVASLRRPGNLADALSGTVVLADLWRASGRPVTAREQLPHGRCTKAQGHGEPVSRATAELHVALCPARRGGHTTSMVPHSTCEAADRLASRAPTERDTLPLLRGRCAAHRGRG